MDWYAEGLRTVNVREAGRIRNNRFGHERLFGIDVRLDARIPTAFEYFGNHVSLLLNVSFPQGCHAGNHTWVLDHILWV